MDCTLFKNFIVGRKRMCELFSRCEYCPLDSLKKKSERRYCSDRCMEQPDDAINIVQKWNDKNPVKTRKSVFLKMFPKASLESNGIPSACAGDVFGFECKEKGNNGCLMCWSKPVED